MNENNILKNNQRILVIFYPVTHTNCTTGRWTAAQYINVDNRPTSYFPSIKPNLQICRPSVLSDCIVATVCLLFYFYTFSSVNRGIYVIMNLQAVWRVFDEERWSGDWLRRRVFSSTQSDDEVYQSWLQSGVHSTRVHWTTHSANRRQSGSN